MVNDHDEKRYNTIQSKDKLRIIADMFANHVLKFTINQFMEDFGKILELKIDNRNNKASLQVLLKGESVPMNITIDGYTINPNNTLELNAVTADRAWINEIMTRFVIGRKIALPPLAATLLRRALD